MMLPFMPTSFSFVSCNIEGHRHLEERLIPFLQRVSPDIVSLQEVFAADMPRLSQVLNMPGFFVPMANITQQTVHHEPLGEWGLAQFSRVPIVAHSSVCYVGTSQVLPTFTPTNPNSMNRVLSWLVLNDGQQELVVATTHFTWSKNGSTSEEQLENLVALEKALDEHFQQGIFSGDFNAPRGDKVFSRLAERFKDNIPPQYTTSIDPELHKAGPLPLMVDGLFSTPEYELTNVELVSGVSDHQAIVATLTKRQ